MEIWKELLRQRPDPEIGWRFGSTMRAQEMGLVGYLIMHSADLESALERLKRFARILSESNRATLEMEGDTGIFTWEPDSRLLVIPQVTDCILAGILSVCREITGARIEPLAVHFPYGKPTAQRPVPSRFERESRWDLLRPALVLKRSDLRRKVIRADTTLGTYLEQHAETTLRSLPAQRSTTRRTRSAIWRQLREGDPTLDGVSRELNVSPRTLQRRLADEGTSFSELLGELRRSLATSLLRDRDLGIHEIAFLLGYSEPSAFYRAFRRWQEVSPSTYRGSARGAR